MTDEGEDKTDEIRDAVGESGTLGGTTDGDSGAILTLDGEDNDSEGEESGDSE